MVAKKKFGLVTIHCPWKATKPLLSLQKTSFQVLAKIAVANEMQNTSMLLLLAASKIIKNGFSLRECAVGIMTDGNALNSKLQHPFILGYQMPLPFGHTWRKRVIS